MADERSREEEQQGGPAKGEPQAEDQIRAEEPGEEPEEPAEGQQRRRRRGRLRLRLDNIRAEWPISGGLTLAGSGVIGVTVVATAWYVFHQRASVEVPNLVGMARSAAEAKLSDKGLNLRATYDEVSNSLAGTVLRSEPPAGTTLSRGSGVSLFLAVPRPSSPPQTPGLTFSPPGPGVILPPGGAYLPYPPNPANPGNLGNPANPAKPANPTNPANPANPRPGSPTNPSQRQVPDLTGLDLQAAEQQLAGNNLAVRSVREEESTQRARTVLRTNPTAGSVVQSGSVVDLVVAKQPAVILGVGRVDPDPNYRDCATGYRFDFSQQVSMTQPGRVTYRWLRSDGAGAPVHYVDFPNPGTQVVTDWWQRTGPPGAELAGWEQIEILTPANLTGQRISFSYICPSRAPAMVLPSASTASVEPGRPRLP